MKSNEQDSFDLMGKPAPMDDDVLELREGCAKALELSNAHIYPTTITYDHLPQDGR